MKLFSGSTSVGPNIRKWRNLRGMKQQELADKIGISNVGLSNIENGKTNITVSRLETIAVQLNLSIHQLMNDPMDLF